MAKQSAGILLFRERRGELEVLLATLVAGGLVALAALDGGVIRHEELRPATESIQV